MKTNSYITTALALALLGAGSAQAAKECPPNLVGDAATVPNSIEQTDINSGALKYTEIREHGRNLFDARFNRCDGSGRPYTTGGGAPRNLPTIVGSEEGEPISAGQMEKLRTSAPDADSCAGCHNQPESGGAGDFVANVFVLSQTLDPVSLSVSPTRTLNRNTLAMHGSGAIEMLTREMTADLQAAAAGLPAGTHTISSKGVDFQIEVDAYGDVVATDGGIDHDLIVKPFHQAGRVISLREFSDNAMNHHHGMQAEERFDLNPGKVGEAWNGNDFDHDGDGMERELTIGDITAVSIWQAQLDAPRQVIPRGAKKQVSDGEQVFADIGCTSCHVPELTLNTTKFVEPNPFNPPGTCAKAADGCPDYEFDLVTEAGFEDNGDGTITVRAYTDLKRHNLCDDDTGPGAIRFFCNEQFGMGRAMDAFDNKPGTEYFLTRKLWDVGNSAPYGHRGDVSTITEAILFHGGEGRASRDAFEAASEYDRTALVTFLKTLQIVPDGSGEDL